MATVAVRPKAPDGSALRGRLAALRRRMRVTTALRGAAWLLLMTAGLLYLAVSLDVVRRIGALPRAAFLVALLGGAAGLVYGLLVRPLRKPVDDLTLALHVEDRYPDLNDALASAVQFLQQPAAEGGAMRREAVRRALAAAQRCDFNRLVRRRDLFALVPVALLVAGLVGWQFARGGEPVRHALLRLADPFGKHDWPYRTSLVVTGHPQKAVAVGTPVLIRAEVGGVIPDKAFLTMDGDGVSPVTLEAEVRPENG